jgi:hypothetical protein
MATTPNGLGANQVLFLRVLASFDGNDAERFWPVSAILKRALEMSPNLRVINPSQVIGTLRRRGLVEGYFGNYRLTTAGMEQCRIIRMTTNADQ